MPLNINISPLAFQKLGLMSDPDKERKQALAEQQAQQARVAEALSAAAQPPPTPSGAFTGMQNGPMSTPVQAPEFGQDFLGAGGSPGQLVDVIRSMDPSQRDHFAEALQAAKNAVLNGEPIDLQPEPLRGLLRDIFKVKAPFDPNSIKSRQDFERGKALGQIPPEMVPQFEQAYPQAPPARPTSVDAFFLADPAEYDRNFGQGAYQKTYDRLKGGGRIKEGGKPDAPTAVQSESTVRARIKDQIADLETKQDITITKDKWKEDGKPPGFEPLKDKNGDTWYTKKDPQVKAQLDSLRAIRDNPALMKQATDEYMRLWQDAGGGGGDVSRETPNQPQIDPSNLPVETMLTLPPEALTPDQMVQVLGVFGIEATANHPRLREAFLKAQAEHGADNR